MAAASVAEMESRFDRASYQSQNSFLSTSGSSYEQSASGKPTIHELDQMNGIHSFVPTFLINFHTVESVRTLKPWLRD